MIETAETWLREHAILPDEVTPTTPLDTRRLDTEQACRCRYEVSALVCSVTLVLLATALVAFGVPPITGPGQLLAGSLWAVGLASGIHLSYTGIRLLAADVAHRSSSPTLPFNHADRQSACRSRCGGL